MGEFLKKYKAELEQEKNKLFQEKKENLKKNFEQKEILLHSNHETENTKLHANYEKEISNLKSQLFLKTEKHNNLKTNVRIFEQESKENFEQIKMFYEKEREETEINWKNAMEMLKNEFEQ